jgi:3',5'-cyclic AMP phosphodiesterase CpdA
MIIAQISDPHITAGGDPASEQRAAQLERAVAHLLRLPARPDIVLVTGDCTDDGSPAAYRRFRELLAPLPMPAYVIPGNHDDRGQLLAAFGAQGDAALAGYAQYVVETWPVRLIALDTHIPGEAGGQLGAERLGWLAERLAEAPARPTLIMMHHPPFATGMAPFDQIGLADAPALAALVARHPQVERIVAGHVHSTMIQRFAGTLAVTCSAIAYQLAPDFGRPDRLAAVLEPPACLLHVWSAGAGLVTHTSLIGDHGPLVDLHDGERWVG